jgi:hypothetical protein
MITPSTYKIDLDSSKRIEVQIVPQKSTFVVYTRFYRKLPDGTYGLNIKEPRVFDNSKFESFLSDLVNRGGILK